MKQNLLLSHLLDKYEKSKHLTQPGTSTRRVMLRIEKHEFPEYIYENAQVRDDWNAVVNDLEARGLISAQWVCGRPVLSGVVLNLDHLSECYRLTGRTHPRELAHTVMKQVTTRLSGVTTDWILAWRDDICHQAKETFRVPSYCKKNLAPLDQLLTAFVEYDSLAGGAMTMRAFSGKCYQNTKTFEREVRDPFLRIASTYCAGLIEACEQRGMSEREQLAYLGIYARPELYELAGNCVIQTEQGEISVAAAAPYGLGLPSPVVDAIQSFDMSAIQKLIFIENKTNYDEFVLSELRPWELVVYHGGFLSPQKCKFFKKMAAALQKQTEIVFWADIDLGGFQMFERLKVIFPTLTPMRMSAEDVTAHHVTGLVRSEQYLKTVQASLACDQYPLFHMAMKKILEYGVTIEQEVFLTESLVDASDHKGAHKE